MIKYKVTTSNYVGIIQFKDRHYSIMIKYKVTTSNYVYIPIGMNLHE